MLSFQEIIVAVEIGTIYGILALGIYLTFRVINFADLTCDGSFVLGAATSAVMVKNGFSPFLGLLVAFLVGGISGFVTGFLNVKCKIEDLLSGIITAFMLYSVNLRVLNMHSSVSLIGDSSIFDSGNCSAFAIVMAILLSMTWLLNSDFGLGLRTIGQNRKFAETNGINVNLMIFIGLILSNAFIGSAGAIFSQYQKFCDVSQGVGCLVIGLASVIIGEKLLPYSMIFKKLNCGIGMKNFCMIFLQLLFCVIGSIIYRIFIALAINSDIFGLQTQDLNLITGLLIIFIMRSNKKC